MDAIRNSIQSELSTGKVRSERIYDILLRMVDAVEALVEAPIAPTPEVVAQPLPTPQAAAPAPPAEPPVPAQEAPPAPKTFGKTA